MGFIQLASLALAMAPFSLASPMVIASSGLSDSDSALIKMGIENALDTPLTERASTGISLAYSWAANEKLFGGSFSKTVDGLSESVSLDVYCVECYTDGSITLSLSDGDIADPKLKAEFTGGFEAYFDIDLTMTAGATYAVTLFGSHQPVGVGNDVFAVGAVCYLDLVFCLSEEIDIEAGFYVNITKDAYIEASILTGDISASDFLGISAKGLPVTLHSGSGAVFQADLRLRIEAGISVDLEIIPGLVDIGAGAELGIYANLIEFEAIIDSTPTCALETIESFDLNAGAFVNLDVTVDYATFQAIPTQSTTLVAWASATQCWIPSGPTPPAWPSYSHTKTWSPHSSYPALPTSYPALPSSYPSLPISYPALPTSYSALPSSYPALPTSYPALPISYPTLPTSYPALPISYPTLPTSYPAVPTSTASSPTGGYSSLSGAISSSSVSTYSGAQTATSSDSVVTSTFYHTTVYTITSCAATVVNCPATLASTVVITDTLDVYTTVCPATETPVSPIWTTTASPATGTPGHHTVTGVVYPTPAPPVTSTFVVPTSAPAATYSGVLAVGSSSAPAPYATAPVGYAVVHPGTTGGLTYTASTAAAAGYTSKPVTAGAAKISSGVAVALGSVVALFMFL